MSTTSPKFTLVPDAEEENIKADEIEPNLSSAPRELANEEQKEKERLELIKCIRADIKKLMAMDEEEVHKKYDDLISWDQDAKLYLGSRSFNGMDGIASLGWPNYQRMNMRQAILNLFNAKLKKLEREPFSI